MSADPPPSIELRIVWPDDYHGPVIFSDERQAQPFWPTPIPLATLLGLFTAPSYMRGVILEMHGRAVRRQERLAQEHDVAAVDARERERKLADALRDAEA